MNRLSRFGLLIVLSVLTAMAGGCNWPAGGGPTTQAGAIQRVHVPKPLDLLLPRRIRIHSFTGTREFSDAGGIKGIDVRIQAVDAYGDATKAFGRFRFELFRHRSNRSDITGERVAVWTVQAVEPKANRRHWNNIMRTYQFKLGWDEPIPVGRKFVLEATFESPFSDRLFDQHVFISGQ